ncbi:MAG: DUF3667 domain-containing protein [Sphingomonadales bacterium]|nr:DUF3667 domain-containing protein [Sphingomonadales bacterium]
MRRTKGGQGVSGSGEIIGNVVDGALVARAAEPVHGESTDGHTHESACLNCGTVLIGSHCHACGQAAHVHKTLGAFFHDLLHGVFHFEGKIWRTLPMLAFRPGQLTREYIDGRRASYVSPIALFLFSVFLMFAVIKQVGGSLDDLARIDSSSAFGIANHQDELTRLEQQRADLVRQGKPLNGIDGQIAGRRAALEEAQKDKQNIADKVHSDVPAVQRAITRMKENPGLGLFKLQANAYKFSWALIPISIPFVWLLFAWRRRFGLYDHTVFVTYSLCFMTLLTSLVALGQTAGVPFLAALTVFAPPVHMYKQLRGTYALGRASALWRTAALLFIALAVLILFALLILAESGA